MKDLVSKILREDYVSAQEIFESRMQSIMERKLLEAKRDMQAEASVIQSKLASGKYRLLTPKERSAGTVDTSIKPDPKGKHTGGIVDKNSPSFRSTSSSKSSKDAEKARKDAAKSWEKYHADKEEEKKKTALKDLSYRRGIERTRRRASSEISSGTE